MAAPQLYTAPVSPDTLITIKITVNDATKKLKLPMRDLAADILPAKLRLALDIKPEQTMILERFSDSANSYIQLDEKNSHAYKTLARAAKAKLKLRLKATVTPEHATNDSVHQSANNAAQSSYETGEKRNIGSGIFQFRDAVASSAVSQPLINFDEPTSHNTSGISQPSRPPVQGASAAPQPQNSAVLSIRPKDFVALPSGLKSSDFVAPPPGLRCSWAVYCNECDKACPDQHFHCSICEDGDYDLCVSCVDGGKSCSGQDHWLIKRSIQDGKIVNSTTEKVAPRKSIPVSSLLVSVNPPTIPKTTTTSQACPTGQPISTPGDFAEETKTLAESLRTPSRTCNSCVVVLPEREFVTCNTCEDFDLCIRCHSQEDHGHHPGHGFEPATDETVLSAASKAKLAAGGSVSHNAVCDGCDKWIRGVRHKCLSCPDWDYCNGCFQYAEARHAGHRFVPIYEPLKEAKPVYVVHQGVSCDGPLCRGYNGYIKGARYKCTVCFDTDFCAGCECHPSNTHDRSHPLLKLQTNQKFTLSTIEESGGRMRQVGDRRPMQPNAATPVQTVAEIKPVDAKRDESIQIPVKKFEPAQSSGSAAPWQSDSAPEVTSLSLNAVFVTETVPDGTVVAPGTAFTKTWKVRNPGPGTWPAGCRLRFTGGGVHHVSNPASYSISPPSLNRTLPPGSEVTFSVDIIAPREVTRDITYWDIAPPTNKFRFNAFRLWCDVAVKDVPSSPNPASHWNAQSSSLQEGPAMVCGRSAYPTPAQVTRDTDRATELRRASIAQRSAQELNALQAQQAQQTRFPLPTGSVPWQDTQLRLMEQARQNHFAHMRQTQSMQAQQHHQMPPARQSLPRDIQAQLELLQAQNIKRLLFARDQQQREYKPAGAMFQSAGTSQEPRREHLPINGGHSYGHAGSAHLSNIAQQPVMPNCSPSMPAWSSNAERDTHETRQGLQAQPRDAGDYPVAPPLPGAAAPAARADVAAPLAADNGLEGSQMVFPKLDKESPESSTYQSFMSQSMDAVKSAAKAAYVENEAGEIEHTSAPIATAMPSNENAQSADHEEDDAELDDEIEVLSATGEESDDAAGFITDDEYDILDASDEETVA